MLSSLKKKVLHYLPPSLVRAVLHGRSRKRLASEILHSYAGVPDVDEDVRDALQYLQNKGLDYIPYPINDKYSRKDIPVFKDEISQLYYVLHQGKKLFYKRGWSKYKIQDAHRQLLVEQDEASPHRYLTENFSLAKSAVVADIGAAEGIFTLENIDILGKAYLFEGDPDWIEPLQKTFELYQDKVTVIEKMVTNRNTSEEVSLDEFFLEKPVDFIKIDVDGGEEVLLQGAKKLFGDRLPLQVAICTYHQQDDAKTLKKYFTERKFETAFSEKYLLFLDDKKLGFPYFRKALLRSKK